MRVKDVSTVVIESTTDIIICARIKYDNVALPMKSNVLQNAEFKGMVEKSDILANMEVECIFVRDNNLYICIY